MKNNAKFPEFKNNNKSPWFTFLAVVFVLTFIWALTNPSILNPQKPIEKVPISEIQELFLSNKLSNIAINDGKIIGTLKENQSQKLAFKDNNYGLAELDRLKQDYLANNPDAIIDTDIEKIDTSTADFLLEIIGSILPFIIIVIIIIFMMRQFQKGANNAFSFGKTKAKLFSKNSKNTTFKDVAGCKEAKMELEEIVGFLKNPKKFLEIGARIPRGVILIGAPGTGKTLLSRAVAGEADVPFFSISGSEFVEMFVGVGASRVRDLFEKAKKNSPAIIFIDEIDAVGRQRGGPGFSGGHDEREQTLNQILSEMDGFEENTNVIVMAATNRPEVLDKALLRPGRFDRRVVIDRPDISDRIAILQVHAKNKKIDKNVDFEKVAKITAGFAGADLANAINEAAILAASNDKKSVSQKDMEYAIEKVMMGPERKSRVLTEKEKKITAIHEAGHAIVSHLLPNCDPVHKVTIISRGMSLGSTWMLPQEERFTTSKSKFEDELCSLLGGYVAEIFIFKEPTTGASSDLERATDIARKMVTRFGMSDLGPISLGEHQDNSFLGMTESRRNFSEEIAEKIDHEINKFIQNALKKTQDLIKKNQKILSIISNELLKKETLDQTEFESFFNKKSKTSTK